MLTIVFLLRMTKKKRNWVVELDRTHLRPDFGMTWITPKNLEVVFPTSK